MCGSSRPRARLKKAPSGATAMAGPDAGAFAGSTALTTVRCHFDAAPISLLIAATGSLRR
eukprot:scaffold5884_cov403-Prasinococcus_capsulatus_cf.AAC.6